jgi:glucose 1-dehydrogenase
MRGRVAIVTGAGGGIGRAIALGYGREGAAVVVNDRSSDAGQETVEIIRGAGGRATAVCADVSDLSTHEFLIKTALDEYGSLTTLVNNAGVEFHSQFLKSTPEIWEKTMGVNLKGAYFLSCKVAQVMIAFGGGKIIHLSSVHDTEPPRDRAIYSISKGGTLMLVKSLALELAEYNIYVNAISPGAILTNMNRVGLSDPAELTRLLEHIPLKRIGQPEDIVGAAVFLACSESDYVTGTTIYVDGGFLLV